MYVPRDSDHPFEEEGGGEGLRAEGADSLEGRPRCSDAVFSSIASW